MRYQWISRLLANSLIDTGEVMAPFAREVLARASAQVHTLVLIIDQSQVNATHQMVRVSLRVGGRAVPLAWQVKNTQGAIGFAEQRAALDRVAALLPAGVRPVLMGDRFYGSPALIAWAGRRAGTGGCGSYQVSMIGTYRSEEGSAAPSWRTPGSPAMGSPHRDLVSSRTCWCLRRV